MSHGIVQDIQTHLNAIEQNETLVIEAHFVSRVNALDALEFRILDRIENIMYEHGYREELARLQQRAERLWQRLDGVNDRLFQRLRGQIMAGNHTVAMLHQLFDTYVGHDVDGNTEDLTGYDCLDVFVDGLLCIDRAPEETKAIKPGMIGYQATPARAIVTLIEQAHLSADDVFYDLGSGLGRVVLLVGLLSAAQARGIEFEPAYCAYAQQRADSLQLSRARFHNIDAREADYADGTVFFLYTPFTGPILQDVLMRLRDEARSRRITVATYGSCTRDVAQQSWLQPIGQQTLHDRNLVLFTSS